jgi:hypothetical protein
MLWAGDDQIHPATGLLIKSGEADYPDDAVSALTALGLVPVEPAAPAPRRRTKGGEE